MVNTVSVPCKCYLSVLRELRYKPHTLTEHTEF
jgi:hypothetical protein